MTFITSGNGCNHSFKTQVAIMSPTQHLCNKSWGCFAPVFIRGTWLYIGLTVLGSAQTKWHKLKTTQITHLEKTHPGHKGEGGQGWATCQTPNNSWQATGLNRTLCWCKRPKCYDLSDVQYRLYVVTMQGLSLPLTATKFYVSRRLPQEGNNLFFPSRPTDPYRLEGPNFRRPPCRKP